jgi:ATP-binding cassette subfamily C protein
MNALGILLTDLKGRTRRLFLRALAFGAVASALEGASSWALLALLALLQHSAFASDGAFGNVPGLPEEFGFYKAWLSYVLISVALVVAQRLFARSSAGLATAYSGSLRDQLLRSIAKAPWLAIRPIPAPDIGHALSAGSQQAGQAARNAVVLLMQGGAVIAQLIVVGIIAPNVIAPGIAILVFFAGVARLTRGSGAALLERLRSTFLRLHQMASDFGLGTKYLKVNGLDVELGNRIRQGGESADLLHRDWSEHSAARKTVATSFGAVVIAGMAYLAQDTNLLPLATLVAVAVVTFRMLPALTGLQQAWYGLRHTADAAITIQSYIQQLADPGASATPREAGSQSIAATAAQPLSSVENAALLTLDNVSVHYPGRAEPVGPFNLQVRSGQWLIISGASGSGKTTLLDLIAGALPLGGAPPPYAGRLAYATQDPFFFHGTLHENLLLGGPTHTTDIQVWEALRICSIGSVVRALPDMLQTRIDSRLSALSGGQRQRIALARALLQAPELLLLDEATNALDASTESRILHAIRTAYPALSVVLATHRAEALQFPYESLELETGVTPKQDRAIPQIA